MFTFFAKIILRSKITQANAQRKKQFLPWNEIKTVALILNNVDAINKSAMDRFIDSTGKLVTVFFVDSVAKTVSYGDWNCFTKKDQNLFGLPTKKVNEEISKTKFDLAINTSVPGDLFSTALLASIEATLKCGSVKTDMAADLIIKKGDPHHVIDYLNEVVRYLKMIKA